MTSEPQESEELSNNPEPADPSALSPTLIELFQTDPLKLSTPDWTFLAQYYETKRMEFQVLERKPKTVKSSRGPKLSKEASKEKMAALRAAMIGSTKKSEA